MSQIDIFISLNGGRIKTNTTLYSYNSHSKWTSEIVDGKRSAFRLLQFDVTLNIERKIFDKENKYKPKLDQELAEISKKEKNKNFRRQVDTQFN